MNGDRTRRRPLAHGIRQNAYRALLWLFALPLQNALFLQDGSAIAQCRAFESAKLVALDAVPESTFGDAVGVTGEVVIVGASSDDEAGSSAGAAYVFRRIGGEWVQEQKLMASDASASAFFGRSVDVSNDVAIVGSFEGSDLGLVTGAAYLFRHNGSAWVEEQKLTLTDAEPGDRFGSAVAVDGGVAVVGADSRRIGLDDAAGAAFVYRYDGSTWLLEDSIAAGDPGEDEFFGNAVDLDSDVLVVGAFVDNGAGLDAGAAYVFRDLGGAWLQEAKLTATDAEAADLFGMAVAVEGGVAVVSASQHDELDQKRGAAFVFREVDGTWIQKQELTASDGEPFDRFGQDVSIFGDTILVGSDDDDFGNASGAAYLYRFVGADWVEQAKLTASTLNTQHFFGSSLAHDGGRAIIAAVGDSEFGAAAGAVYSFDIPALTLDVVEEVAVAGDTLEIGGCGGVPGNSISFAAVEFGGLPFFRVLDVGSVAVDGRWSSSLLVPENPALPGNSARFLLRSFDRFGVVVFSNGDWVGFE